MACEPIEMRSGPPSRRPIGPRFDAGPGPRNYVRLPKSSCLNSGTRCTGCPRSCTGATGPLPRIDCDFYRGLRGQMTHALIQYSYLQLLDLLTTMAFLLHGVREGNPLVRFAMENTSHPLGGLFAVKGMALLLGC